MPNIQLVPLPSLYHICLGTNAVRNPRRMRLATTNTTRRVPWRGKEQLTICVPGRSQQPTSIAEEDTPANLLGDEDEDAPQYAGRIHQFPARSTRSGFMRSAEGGGAMLAFTAVETIEDEFTPTPSAPVPQTVALQAPDENEWRAAVLGIGGSLVSFVYVCPCRRLSLLLSHYLCLAISLFV
jgi:hypothetical protein